MNEGSIWEAALSASKHKLDNLTLIIDYNKIQSYGFLNEVVDIEPLKKKLEGFGFFVDEINGHDIDMIKLSLKNNFKQFNQPKAIICHTIKGKGIIFAENNPNWHHKSQLTKKEIKEMYDSINL